MRRYIIPALLAIALIATAGWGVYQQNQSREYHTYLDLQFQRQFYELIGHVENAQVDLSKAMISGTSKDMTKYLYETLQQAYLAQEKLTQLPFHHATIRKTEKFLSQLGDYSTAMANKSIEGITLSESEFDTLKELQAYANFLSRELIEMQQQVVSGGVNFGDLRKEGNRDLNRVNDQMKNFRLINIEERMQEYPELIYDGPFSEHIKDITPRLTGKEVSSDEAIEAARTSLKNQDLKDIRLVGLIENTRINGYYLRATQTKGSGQEISIAISKTGGKIIWFLNPRDIGDSKLDKEESKRVAEDFLKEQGYNDMVATYTMAAEGQIVVNFAYKQGDVIVYPDLIKVKVALDNGEIIGMETDGYLTTHHKRDIEKPKLTLEEAREKLNSAVEVEYGRLVIIPASGKKEILTYEFKVQFGEDHYLIYIDAESGEQRRILLMIQQEDGTLVI